MKPGDVVYVVVTACRTVNHAELVGLPPLMYSVTVNDGSKEWVIYTLHPVTVDPDKKRKATYRGGQEWTLT
jgi:hypothetical protein